jgi:hypothetical protein
MEPCKYKRKCFGRGHSISLNGEHSVLCARLQPIVLAKLLLRRISFPPLSLATPAITKLQVIARAIALGLEYVLSTNCARSSNSHYLIHLLMCTLPALCRKMPWSEVVSSDTEWEARELAGHIVEIAVTTMIET